MRGPPHPTAPFTKSDASGRPRERPSKVTEALAGAREVGTSACRASVIIWSQNAFLPQSRTGIPPGPKASLKSQVQKPDPKSKSRSCPMARDSDSIRKRIAFEVETFNALDCLAKDRMVTLQELADEAFRDLLKKHVRPVTLEAMLRASARSRAANDL